MEGAPESPLPSEAAVGPSPAEEQTLRELLHDLGRIAPYTRFDVAPNPCVGACVLSSGVEIGRGFHSLFGGPHAEMLALSAAEASGVPRERWDTLVCTLEPCSSSGKTPPCTEAILGAGLRRCVVGELDPDPRHRGRGLQALTNAGIEVVLLRGAAPLARVAPHFIDWTRPERLRRTRPWTIAKWAQTRTGQLRPPTDRDAGAPKRMPREMPREPAWISGPHARHEVHELRGRVDAIVTGIGTVLADDPRLTVRPPAVAESAPLRVVLDGSLRTSPHARLFETPGEGELAGPVHVVTRSGADPGRARALRDAGATLHAVRSGDDGRPSLRETQSLLWDLGVRRVLLEAGPKLLEAYFENELIDQVRVYTGPVNGGEGPDLAEWLSPERLADVAHGEVGTDARLDGFVRRRSR